MYADGVPIFPATPPHRDSSMGDCYDPYGGGGSGLGFFNPFKAIGKAAGFVGKTVFKGVKAVAKPAISVAKFAAPIALPVVGTAISTGLNFLTRSRQSPDAADQSAFPGTAWPSTAPVVPTTSGFSVNDIFAAVKNEMLRQGGQYIARTPQGQQAIRQEFATQARQQIGTTATNVLPWALAAGIPLVLLLAMRK